MTKSWADFISAEDESRYERAGFGHSSGVGSRPALLVIDVQFRTLGDSPKPFDQALEDYTTAVGEAGWAAVDHVVRLLDTFRHLSSSSPSQELAEKITELYDDSLDSDWSVKHNVPEDLKNVPNETYKDSDIPLRLPTDLEFSP